ncbi:hypothetical protein J0J29_23655, partial [Vibrio vulnificus]|uniref:hypothetical protein n=1 Tax=Vibrio vulnificus TaxID=672 RepID=UPI0019D49F94
KKEIKQSKKELGSFYKQFKYSFTKEDCNGGCSKKPKHRSSKRYHKFSKSESCKESYYKKPYKKMRKPFRKSKNSAPVFDKSKLKD